MKSEYEWMSDAVGRKVYYLGDAVYASFDGYQIWLHTTNGLSITNKIALEPNVWQNLVDFRNKIGK